MTLLREREAARALGGLSVKTLQAWRVRGTGPAFIKVGRLIRYAQESLERYLQERTRTSTSKIT